MALGDSHGPSVQRRRLGECDQHKRVFHATNGARRFISELLDSVNGGELGTTGCSWEADGLGFARQDDGARITRFAWADVDFAAHVVPHADDESGKSTLLQFLVDVFEGLPEQKSQEALDDVWVPWQYHGCGVYDEESSSSSCDMIRIARLVLALTEQLVLWSKRTRCDATTELTHLAMSGWREVTLVLLEAGCIDVNQRHRVTGDPFLLWCLEHDDWTSDEAYTYRLLRCLVGRHFGEGLDIYARSSSSGLAVPDALGSGRFDLKRFPGLGMVAAMYAQPRPHVVHVASVRAEFADSAPGLALPACLSDVIVLEYVFTPVPAEVLAEFLE